MLSLELLVKSETTGILSNIRQVVSVYIGGETVGALVQTAIGDRLGRIRFMQLMCILVTIGTVIQTASVNIGMFLAGRVLAGIAVG
jgi:predicted MFS family arabinose efflux permease